MLRANFIILIAAFGVLSVSARAETVVHDSSVPAREQILVSVTSFVGGTMAGAYARHELTAAAGRRSTETIPVLNGLGAPESAAFIESTLSGTSPGDVVRLQYTVGTRTALRQVLEKLKQSNDVWEQRVADLTAAHQALAERIAQGEKQMSPRLANALRLEAENLNVVLTDASSRLQMARTCYRAALRKEQNVMTIGAFRNGLPITHDVLVTETTAADMRHFYETEVVKPVRTRSRPAYTNVTIVKIRIQNASLVARHLMRAKAGLVGVGIALGVVVEEMTVGAIGHAIENDLEGHYAPKVRTEPKSQ